MRQNHCLSASGENSDTIQLVRFTVTEGYFDDCRVFAKMLAGCFLLDYF